MDTICHIFCQVPKLFGDNQKGKLGNRPFKWLVQCKDNSVTGKTVSENDFPTPIQNKCVQHGCEGFLLVTSTTVTSGLKKLLDAMTTACPPFSAIRTKVWDKHELTSMLLEQKNESLLTQFFPISLERRNNARKSIEKLTSQTADYFVLRQYSSILDHTY